MRPYLWCLTITFFSALHGAYAAETPLANGVFLVAKPGLLDPNFRETVVLITEPEAGSGPFGVIVNRSTSIKISEVVPGISKFPSSYDQIYSGGPVTPQRLLFLVRAPKPPEHSLQVLSDVYLTGDGALLSAVGRGEASVTAFRAYAGLSGWAPGQLQAEILAGGWFVVPADADTIFAADPSVIWKQLIERASRQTTELSPQRFRFENYKSLPLALR